MNITNDRAPGRPAVKKTMVINMLRKRITTGELKPGERIPSRRALSTTYNATLRTVQQALVDLENDGFVSSMVGKGTFVTEKPPHLSDFALVFPKKPDIEMYLYHLASAAQYVINEMGLRLSVYYEVNSEAPGKDYKRLIDDIQNDRIAGIIFAQSPFNIKETSLIEKKNIPRVRITSSHKKDMSNIIFDNRSFIHKSIALLKSQGISKVGFLGHKANYEQFSIEEFTHAGMTCPYHWQHAMPLTNKKWSQNLIRLMFSPENRDKPEALILLDDNFFKPVLSGLIDAGVKVPEDLYIISHSNFPWQVETPFPVTFIGYDMIELLEYAMEELESQRSGNTPNDITLPCHFENELEHTHLNIDNLQNLKY